MPDNHMQAYLLMEEIQRGLAEHEGGLSCSGTVPVVLQLEAEHIASWFALKHDRAQELVAICLEWITARRDGLQMYEKIIGRAYTQEEKHHLDKEIRAIRLGGCPFLRENGCILPIRPIKCWQIPLEIQSRIISLETSARTLMPHLNEYGVLPTLLAAKLNRPQLTALINEGRVPDAVLALSHTP